MLYFQQLSKTVAVKRLNGMVLNGEAKVNGFGDVAASSSRVVNGTSSVEVAFFFLIF